MSKKFVYGVPVSDYNFTGREEESKRLMMDFKSGINVILMSPRRYGKTSLVKHVCQQLKDEGNIITVYTDIFGCKTEYEIYNKLAVAVLQQTASHLEQWIEEAKDFIYRLTPKLSFNADVNSEFSVSLGITPETHTPEQILSLAETIAMKKGKHIVVCIDEFQQVGELANSKQIQATMRSVWQHCQHTSYCLFGSKHHLMGSMFLNKSMPFFQFGDLMALKKIPTETWTQYIVSHFADGNRTISTTQAEMICNLVDNYSAYVQQLSWLIFSQTDEGEVVTDELIQLGFNDLLSTCDILYMQIVESLSEYQMNFLRAIVSGVKRDLGRTEIRNQYKLGSYSNIARLKSALIEKDLIESNLKTLHITDPVFAKWFERKMM